MNVQSVSSGDTGESSAGYEYFRRKLKERSGVDLAAYKDRQMVRRLMSYLKRVDVPNFFVLAKKIERDDEALGRLKDFLTINVTDFFRNPDRYADLERRVLPELARRFGTLRIWSAGCSNGAEPYSLSILLEEMGGEASHDVLATDIDAAILKVARDGVYEEEKLRGVTKERRRFFRAMPDGRWQIKPATKSRVRFRAHDLLADPYPKGVHLILCRNVVIYFTDQAKEGIYRRFADALEPGGYMMIGSTESIFCPGRYGLRSAGPFVYQK